MLYLIGLGLDIKDISIKSIEVLKRCDKIYFENYTNVMNFDIKDIEKIIKSKVIMADRQFVEENEQLLKEAKSKKIALLVSGDPLSATTHIDLIIRAKKMKIKTRILHAPSIFTAIAETGLQLYKFGKTASIAKWTPTFRPESFYEIIKKNLEHDAHTLILIDIGMEVNEALGYLESIAKARDPMMLERKIVVCQQLGTENQRFYFGKISSLMKKKFRLPACIIIPAKLHFVEEEFLNSL